MTQQQHWTGNLVDTECMSSALGRKFSPYVAMEPLMYVPHVVGEGKAPPPSAHASTPGGVAAQTAQPPSAVTRATHTSEFDQSSQYSSVDLNEGQRAQLDELSRVEKAAGNCGVSPLTESLGLAMADGKVVQFDQPSCAKVRGTLKNANALPGMKVKAKVTGIIDDSAMMRIAEVEVRIKGK